MSVASPLVLLGLLPLAVLLRWAVPARWSWLPLLAANVAYGVLLDAGGFALAAGLSLVAWMWPGRAWLVVPLVVAKLLGHVPPGLSYLTFALLLPRREPHVGRFLAGALLFPARLQGPIASPAQASRSRMTWRRFAFGVERFVGGFARMSLIAQPLGIAADRLWAVPPGHLSLPAAWWGLLLYSVQLYHDFAGATAMARGAALMLGVWLPANFHHPYRARSLARFWRCWHASLTRWFRDMLYRPLVRRGWHPLLAGGLVFVISGIWHGVGGTFIIWGVWHALFWYLERVNLPVRDASHKRLWCVLTHARVLMVVALGWVWFRAPNVHHALGYFAALSGFGDEAVTLRTDHATLLALVAGIVLCVQWPRLPVWLMLPLRLLILAACVVRFVAGGYAPPLYGRF